MGLADEIVVRVRSSTLVLRPTLRASLQLERRYGFDQLLGAIADGNVGVMADVATANRFDLCGALAGVPLADVLPTLIDAVSRHVLVLAGIDPDKPAQA